MLTVNYKMNSEGIRYEHVYKIYDGMFVGEQEIL